MMPLVFSIDQQTLINYCVATLLLKNVYPLKVFFVAALSQRIPLQRKGDQAS